MKKLLFVFVAAAMIVSCQSKGNKMEMVSESETDSLAMLNDSTLGDWQTFTYEGMLPAADAEGINYLLTIQEQDNDSIGDYTLTMTYIGTKDGKNQTMTSKGKGNVMKGVPGNNNIIVYQLIPEDGGETMNFIAEGDSALTMVGKDFKKAMSKLNYTLKKMK